jgi:PcfJ-like protein
MKRSNRAATRDWVNSQRAKARAFKLRQDAAEEEKLRKVEAALARNNQEKSLLASLNIEATHFWKTIESKAPKLLTKEYLGAVTIVNTLQHHRPIADWEPRGKGRTTIFNSLCDHLLAKFPTPQFLWSAFWEPDVLHALGVRTSGETIIKTVSRISRGDSFSKMCKSGDFPITFTNKQCHDFLQSSSDSTFMAALRRTQIQTHGGDIRLLKVLMSRDNGKTLSNIVEETFLDSVIAWFSKNPMLDLAQFNPLMDYVWYRWREDKTFSMKGRSPIALMRAMQEWHDDLAKRQIIHGKEYKPSGFKAGHWEFDHRDGTGNFVRVHYSITEILNSKDLHAEGKALRHCVLSYSSSIEQGHCSIWSMRLNDDRLITIEVRRDSRSIVQARGRCNRATSAEEFRIMQRWAQDNSLNISIGRW